MASRLCDQRRASRRRRQDSLRSKKIETIDLGNGITLHTDPIAELDLGYQHKNGAVIGIEIKATANSLVERFRNTKQLENLVRWQNRVAGREAYIHIRDEQHWTKIFSLTDPKDIQSYGIDALVRLRYR